MEQNSVRKGKQKKMFKKKNFCLFFYVMNEELQVPVLLHRENMQIANVVYPVATKLHILNLFCTFSCS